jgi:hypothetical protein
VTVSFRPAKREGVFVMLGFAGGTGSGKTMSGLRNGAGIADGHPMAAVDTENGRMSHYADMFPNLNIAQISAPFRPEKYTEALDAGVAFLKDVPRPNRVIIVDSMSHEWAGDGGCLDWQEELMGGNQARSPQAWAQVKKAHKRMVTHLLGVPAHVILCFRAEPKIDIVREGGELKFVPKKGPTGLDGWMPISEKMLPYELTASFLLMADQPGVPKPIKLQEQHKPFVPLDQPLSENTGKLLAAWAAGSSPNSGGNAGTGDATSGEPAATVGAPPPDVSPATSGGEPASPDDIYTVTARLVGASSRPQETAYAIEMKAKEQTAEEHLAWLIEQERKHFAGARGGDAR